MNSISPNRTRDMSQDDLVCTVRQHAVSSHAQQLRALGSRLKYAALIGATFATNAMAQGGGQGNGDAVSARMSTTSTMVQTIIYTIAGSAFMGAGVWHTIGIATGHKKWSDLGNVTGAMMAGGLITAAVTWLYT